jgi:hypothetical protein
MNLGLLLAVVVALLFVLSPVALGVLIGWRRGRRAEATARQIALTDAIDARLGPIVAPVVTKPLWGPWHIRIAAPFAHPATLGRVLALTHETLTALDGGAGPQYRIVLTARPDAVSVPAPGSRWRVGRAAA